MNLIDPTGLGPGFTPSDLQLEFLQLVMTMTTTITNCLHNNTKKAVRFFFKYHKSEIFWILCFWRVLVVGLVFLTQKAKEKALKHSGCLFNSNVNY